MWPVGNPRFCAGDPLPGMDNGWFSEVIPVALSALCFSYPPFFFFGFSNFPV